MQLQEREKAAAQPRQGDKWSEADAPLGAGSKAISRVVTLQLIRACCAHALYFNAKSVSMLQSTVAGTSFVHGSHVSDLQSTLD